MAGSNPPAENSPADNLRAEDSAADNSPVDDSRHRYPDLVEQGRGREEELVRVEVEGTRATVTLDDPNRLNSLGTALMVQLVDALRDLAAEPAIRCVVLTGTDPAFSAGGDLEMIADGSRAIRDDDKDADTSDSWRWIRHQFGGVVRAIVGSEKFFIAAINGPAAGVGLAFALACDVLIMSERGVLVPAFGKLGLVPEVGTSWFLTRRLGYQGSIALYVKGEHIEADEALRLGLVQEVHPHDELAGAADRWCERVERLPGHAFPMTKSVLRESTDASWHQALGIEEFAEANCFSTESLSRSAEALRGSVRRTGP